MINRQNLVIILYADYLHQIQFKETAALTSVITCYEQITML